jgi:thioredoxin-like negative regulator of GroEL
VWTRSIGAERAQLVRAEAQVERMANHFPDNANILFYLGALYHLTNKTFEAETTLLRVIDLDPDNVEARDELIRVRRTIESDRRGPPGLLRRLVGKG